MNQLQVIEQKVVSFNGRDLMAVKTNDNKIYVGVSWICNGIGFNKSQKDTQVQKIQSDLVLKQGCLKFQAGVFDENNEMLGIELDYLPLWLAKISLTPKMQQEAPWTVNNLVNYQLKAKDVLAEAFLPKAQPTTQAELIAMIAQQGVEQERRLNAVERKQQQLEKQHDNITEIISLNPTEWRKKVNDILNKIGQSRGGFAEYQKVRQESYEKLEERAKCKLEIRLRNRIREAREQGIMTRAQIGKLSKLDVIAGDARLTEIYLAIVKEMAIANKIDFLEQ